MSRIGKKPIALPKGVSVVITDGVVTVKGAKGSLSQDLCNKVTIAQAGDIISVEPITTVEKSSAYWGLYRTLVANMVQGVSAGFSKTLEIQGTGYRASLNGKNLGLSLGFSHPVEIAPPENIDFEVDKTGLKVTVHGISKQMVGKIAADVRNKRPVEPYKGKGVRYAGEVVILKVGKSAKK
jgi:large subunit ribosomal protein L6